MTNPTPFGRAARIKQTVSELCDARGVHERWCIKVAALLSQLGCVTLPPDVAERFYCGQPLVAEEGLVRKLPEVVLRLFGHIPRLEPILEILAVQLRSQGRRQSPVRGRASQRASCILAAAMDCEVLESRGLPIQTVIDTLLVGCGYDVTDGFVARAHSFPCGRVKEPVRVIVRPPATPGTGGGE
ncbi:MAG: hypothetical protein HYV63_12405 [Candidatus Schekmanbacteria bacterium]|nr:hypothetical protein [Candidatus Schekmanbacteria bacterium]